MGGCRFRYEDLPASVKAQVDAALGKAAPKIEARKGRKERIPNKTEAAYQAEVLQPRQDVTAARYEGLTFRMANGHRYTPDWLVVTSDGQIECHEVKGGYALHSQQRAKLAFDQARVEFPWAAWVWAVRSKQGWKILGPASSGSTELCRGDLAETKPEDAS